MQWKDFFQCKEHKRIYPNSEKNLSIFGKDVIQLFCTVLFLAKLAMEFL
jgi:hypothetical protein